VILFYIVKKRFSVKQMFCYAGKVNMYGKDRCGKILQLQRTMHTQPSENECCKPSLPML
jgi:hypothetical protein